MNALVPILLAAACMISGEPDRLLLDAMRQVESAGRDRVVGRAGERGPYQITRAYWADGTKEWYRDGERQR